MQPTEYFRFPNWKMEIQSPYARAGHSDSDQARHGRRGTAIQGAGGVPLDLAIRGIQSTEALYRLRLAVHIPKPEESESIRSSGISFSWTQVCLPADSGLIGARYSDCQCGRTAQIAFLPRRGSSPCLALRRGERPRNLSLSALQDGAESRPPRSQVLRRPRIV